MRKKKIISGFLCGIVLASTIIHVSAAPITLYTVNRSWTTDCISATSEESDSKAWKEINTASVSIGMDSDIHADIESGETITFTSNIDTGREDSVVETIEWYVNDKRVQTTTIDSTQTAKSTFKLTYTQPTFIYCTYSGTQNGTDNEGNRRYSEFSNLSSNIISLGKTSSDVPMGSRWAWTKLIDGDKSVFIAPQNGTYELYMQAADGNTVEKDIKLNEGSSYTVSFGTDGSTAFGNVSVPVSNPGSVEPIIKLKLKDIQVVIEKEPSEIVADEGTTATVSVLANGGGEPMTYQWYRIPAEGDDGTAIEGATGATYMFPAQLSQNGTSLYCVVSNGQTEAITMTAPVKICSAPQEAPAIKAWNGEGELIEATTWTRGISKIQISAAGTIVGAGELKMRYSLDDGKTWTETDRADIEILYENTQTGKLPVIAETYNSLSPKLKKETILRLHTDNTGPIITVKDNPASWTNKDVVITINATDSGCGVVGAAYSWDNGQTWTRENNITVTGNKTINVLAKDAIGNISSADIKISKIDKEEPELEVSGNPKLWKKGPATLKATGSDKLSGLAADKPYSWDGGKTWTNENTYEVSTNQTIKVQVKDNAGNIKEKVVEVTKLDKEGPIVEVTGNPKDWQKKSVTLTISATDNGIGSLNPSPYSWNGGKNWVSDKQKTFLSNQTVTVVVRDALGNKTESVVEIDHIDKDDPTEFTIKGVPEEYTNSEVRLSIEDASDKTSGLAENAYNWNNEGWTDSNTYRVVENRDVSVAVRDKAGHERQQTVKIEKIDTTPPTVTAITGIPAKLQNTPAVVTVVAGDAESGLAETPYSFDNGKTWQSSPTATFWRNQEAGLKVMDAAGNIIRQPLNIINVDTEPPKIEVLYLDINQDESSVVVKINGTDTVSKSLWYCFDYKDNYPDLNIWTTDNEKKMDVGVRRVVACKDEMGNIEKTEITPNIYDVGMNPQSSLFMDADRLCPIEGYTFGPVDNNGHGMYLDSFGNPQDYHTYQIGGRTVTGLDVEIEGTPTANGFLTGKAKINDVEIPIFWDEENTQTYTNAGGTGHFLIDPTRFKTSAKLAMVQIILQEYKDETLQNLVNTDTISCSISIDMSQPYVQLEFDEKTKVVKVEAQDDVSGISIIKYRLSKNRRSSEWTDYTGEICLKESCTVEVYCVDKAGNICTPPAKKISIPNIFKVSQTKRDKKEVFYYKTNDFEHYLFGTGKTSLTQPPEN